VSLLADGVYESIVTQALERAIGEATRVGRSVQVEDLSAVEGTSLLVRHLAIAEGDALQALLAVYRDATKPPRPQTPLSLSSLLTGAAGEPRLGLGA